MPGTSRSRRLLAEALGTGLLLATVIGSGIMGAKLAGGNAALALLANTLPTGAILVVLILIFGPVSGAHFNPAVTLAFAMRGELPWHDLLAYVAVQVVGATAGVWLAHAMFELPVWQLSTTARSGSGQWLAEMVASFGLLLAILGCVAVAPSSIAYAVGLFITAAYWFTARPRSPIRRSPSRAASATRLPALPRRTCRLFIAAQLAGAVAALPVARWLWPQGPDSRTARSRA